MELTGNKLNLEAIMLEFLDYKLYVISLLNKTKCNAFFRSPNYNKKSVNCHKVKMVGTIFYCNIIKNNDYSYILQFLFTYRICDVCFYYRGLPLIRGKTPLVPRPRPLDPIGAPLFCGLFGLNSSIRSVHPVVLVPLSK